MSKLFSSSISQDIQRNKITENTTQKAKKIFTFKNISSKIDEVQQNDSKNDKFLELNYSSNSEGSKSSLSSADATNLKETSYFYQSKKINEEKKNKYVEESVISLSMPANCMSEKMNSLIQALLKRIQQMENSQQKMIEKYENINRKLRVQLEKREQANLKLKGQIKALHEDLLECNNDIKKLTNFLSNKYSAETSKMKKKQKNEDKQNIGSSSKINAIESLQYENYSYYGLCNPHFSERKTILSKINMLSHKNITFVSQDQPQCEAFSRDKPDSHNKLLRKKIKTCSLESRYAGKLFSQAMNSNYHANH